MGFGGGGVFMILLWGTDKANVLFRGLSGIYHSCYFCSSYQDRVRNKRLRGDSIITSCAGNRWVYAIFVSVMAN